MRLLLCISMCLFLQSAIAQEPFDTLKVTEPDTTHSFKKAMIYSAIIPGAGQIYNHCAMPKGQKKAYWKVPLILAGLGSTGYFAYYNNHLKNELRTEYEWRADGNDPSKFKEYDDDGLLSLYSISRTRRDLCFVGLAAVYVLNIVDAGVEAHFVNFDVSDDISLRIQPRFYMGNAVGIGLTFNFR